MTAQYLIEGVIKAYFAHVDNEHYIFSIFYSKNDFRIDKMSLIKLFEKSNMISTVEFSNKELVDQQTSCVTQMQIVSYASWKLLLGLAR